MSFLEGITKGKQVGAQVHVIAGSNGVGKTTFAASFPFPLIIDLEKGSEHLNVARVPADKVPTLDTLRAILKELATTTHDFKTVTIDSIESLESLITDAVCAEGKVKSIELYDGGYGKGWVRSREIMREIFGDLRLLQAKGITAILVGHTQVKSHTDPTTNQTYDRVVMRANDKLASVIRDLADNVLFATHKVFTTEKNKKTQAFGDGQRVIYSQYRPGWDAKNRLDLPFELPLSYDAFIEACNKKPEVKIEELITNIEEMSSRLDDKLKTTVKEQVTKFKTNPEKLREIQNRISKLANA